MFNGVFYCLLAVLAYLFFVSAYIVLSCPHTFVCVYYILCTILIIIKKIIIIMFCRFIDDDRPE